MFAVDRYEIVKYYMRVNLSREYFPGYQYIIVKYYMRVNLSREYFPGYQYIIVIFTLSVASRWRRSFVRTSRYVFYSLG